MGKGVAMKYLRHSLCANFFYFFAFEIIENFQFNQYFLTAALKFALPSYATNGPDLNCLCNDIYEMSYSFHHTVFNCIYGTWCAKGHVFADEYMLLSKCWPCFT